MRTLIEFLAGLAILTNAVIYGTDVLGAIVLRPAIAGGLIAAMATVACPLGSPRSEPLRCVRFAYRKGQNEQRGS
jgi:hypothetical protein